MATARDLATAIDAFVGAPKRIIGADQPYLWKDGRSYVERVASFPIEINGEAPQAARFEVIGFPQAAQLKFRLILCYNACIARLDYTDETHANTQRIETDRIPPLLTGPHYHSWPLNRRFFQGASKAPELHNAKPFLMQARFDSILRWFCDEMNIGQLNGGHLIALPPRERLL
jgi:hypothetical protein